MLTEKFGAWFKSRELIACSIKPQVYLVKLLRLVVSCLWLFLAGNTVTFAFGPAGNDCVVQQGTEHNSNAVVYMSCIDPDHGVPSVVISAANSISTSGIDPGNLHPLPVTPRFVVHYQYSGVLDMGTAYNGNCSEVIAGQQMATLTSGHSYCAVWNGAGNPEIRMGLSFDGTTVTGQFAYRLSQATQGMAVPIPALGHWYLALLSLMLAALAYAGLRRYIP